MTLPLGGQLLLMRLLKRLRADGQELPPCTELRRTNRNRQTSIGAWSWFAWCPLAADDPAHYGHGKLHVGSHWPMRWLLAVEQLNYTKQEQGDICVDPAPAQQED